jgi:CzcA family heavy metal efflux pump
MFDAVIRGALTYRWLVLTAGAVVLFFGVRTALVMPVDVLPDLTAPSVTVVTESGGMTPEEVERTVTTPIEHALHGAAGVRRLRSSSAIGISLVWVDFEWDVEPRVARQTVAERLTTIRASLPEGIEPEMAPASSIMGEVMFVGLTGDGASESELRGTAEWVVRRRLLSISGVAQVVAIGGDVAQVEIVLSPEKLMRHRIGTATVLRALDEATESRAGGFHVVGAQEYVVRAVGRPTSLADLEVIAVGRRDDVPIRLGDVAEVRFGKEVRRGAAAVDGDPAVVLKVQKQPGANTLELTRRIDAALDDLATSLPDGMQLYRKGFRQADFIRVSIDNVMRSLLEASLLVVLILALFMVSWRTTVISLLALPLSLAVGVLVLEGLGGSINTMTLGGFAIAIGELVDDAIIDVENVHRRLRENGERSAAERRPTFDVVLDASREIRGSIVYATIIIAMVFAPLFFLSGLEGRLLAPIGVAFVTAIAASLFVALTITPVLCLLLLGRGQGDERVREGRLARWLKRGYRPLVAATLRAPLPIALASLAGAVAAVIALSSFGRSFLPEFNEGSLNIAAATAPGTSLATSEEIVERLEDQLLAHPAVTSVIRMTGRAEKDEHALDVNFSELEVGLDLAHGDREAVFADVREQAAAVPGLAVTVGQPISHRIEHMVSGVRASLVVKLFGPDLDELRKHARAAEAAMKGVPGTVDLAIEQITEIPVLAIQPRPTELATFGQAPGDLTRFVSMSLAGARVGSFWEGERSYPLVARLPEGYRDDFELMKELPIDRDGERYARLASIARLEKTLGPNLINHENAQRRLFVTANIAGRDLLSVAREVDAAVRAEVPLPSGYRYELGGEFEQEAAASRSILGLSLVALAAIALLLFSALGSFRDALIVLVNLPLALIGGVIAVWLGGGVISIASLVGFITLFGIATRNGIMMITHYRHLIEIEGRTLRDAVIDGSTDRLLPILMTALTAALALVPIARASHAPGGEIQGPMALVILGGLASSTILNLVVVPTIFARFARERAARPAP